MDVMTIVWLLIGFALGYYAVGHFLLKGRAY